MNRHFSTGGRESRLDSLRFFAALCVAVAHCMTSFSPKPYHAQTFSMMDFADIGGVVARIVQMVFNAHSAVVIFFVLSGYVLTKSLHRIESRRYPAEFAGFFTRRLFRLLPILACSILILRILREYPAGLMLKNMVLLDTTINPAAWTLPVEVAGSLLTFVAYVIRREKAWLSFLLLAGLMALFFSSFSPVYAKYMLAFFVGSSLDDVRAVCASRLKGGVATIAAAVVMITADFVFGYKTNTSIIVQTICAGLVIMNLNGIGALGFMESRPVAFLGRISFSFYLLHLVGMQTARMICAKAGIALGEMPMLAAALVLAVLSVAITVLISPVTYYVCERTFIKAGSRVSRLVTGGSPGGARSSAGAAARPEEEAGSAGPAA